jgi:hypothetical protein
VRCGTTRVTASSARGAAALVRQPSTPSSAHRVRRPSALSRAVQSRAHTCTSRWATRGLLTPPCGPPHVVACPRPSSRTPPCSHGRRHCHPRRSRRRRGTRRRTTSWARVATEASRAASTTSQPPPRGAVTRLTAWAARHRTGRGRWPRRAARAPACPPAGPRERARSERPAAVVGRLAWAAPPAAPAAAWRARLTEGRHAMALARCAATALEARASPMGAPVLPGPPPPIGPVEAGVAPMAPTVSGASRPRGRACAGVVVRGLRGGVGRVGPAPSLTSPLTMGAAEALPAHRVRRSRSSTVVWPPPTSAAAAPWTSTVVLSQGCQRRWATAGRTPARRRCLSRHTNDGLG